MQSVDSRLGLDYITENPEYVRKLAAALDTNNITVKKQVFELLSALCVHNPEGRTCVTDTLEYYRNLKNERYRLNIIIQELERATVVEYQTALVAFINCYIISTPRLADRIRLRNEFIGCHLLPVLNNLRKNAESEPELALQLDVFDEQRESDDAQNLQGAQGVDLNSPLDVFYAILKQVADTPKETPFLSILQHLLKIDPKESFSDIIWDTAERLVHRATLLETREEAARMLRAPSLQSRLTCTCQHRSEPSQSRKQSLTTALPMSPPPGPPPPPPPFGPLPPPPPPPPNICTTSASQVPALESSPNQRIPTKTTTSSLDSDTVSQKLPQQEIPTPKIKMKTFNWNKIPSNKVIGKNNIWTQVAYSHQHSPVAGIDLSEMEGLFCQQSPPSAQSSPKLGSRDSTGATSIERRMKRDSSEIALLDGKRSLNVNIFLKQFRSSNEDIIQLIRNGEHDDIGAEKLKGLLKIMPEIDELEMLKSFNGDYDKLGNAEKFLIQLINLSNYKLRVESMLLKEEFTSNMSYLEPSISSMINAAHELMTNKPLQEVLYMILVTGNFLNSGGYAGGAAGVKLTSLQKITEIRANKPNMNLIHFVALQAEKRSIHLLSFVDKTGLLEDAAKTTVEQLLNEINALDTRIKKIKKQIDLPTTEHEIKHQMIEFLHMAESEVSNLQRNMIELEYVRKELADFFCEDVNTFKLEECFRIFHCFCCKFKQAVSDNDRRRIQEEQANARRRQREELLAAKRKQLENMAADSDVPIIEMQIYDARTGFPLRKGNRTNTSEDETSIIGSPLASRRRLGSFNGCENTTGKEEKSPDITPNGSLRRRRSRVLSEEDEGNLMDFLRTSGSENNRERKSWGSLDRSWARKARGSTRKRPALLTTDFTSERERPSSPSPLAESKTVMSTPDEEPAPKEWKQKIENWLQTNENDQISDENRDSRRQARRLANRVSLEMDSESERSSTLDTLPEGKQLYSGSQSSYRKAYPAWQPSTAIEKTDVVSAIETVEDAQPYHIKDKSAWRKSTLNVSNSTEETNLRHRHTLPRTHSSTSETSSKKPEGLSDKRTFKSYITDEPSSDTLTLYFRPPDPTQPSISGSNSNLQNVNRRIRDSQQSLDTISNNKIDIDQDNVETPPAVRKVFSPNFTERREPVPPTPCRRLMGRPRDDELDFGTPLGDGQFDRFSATRRTRRYKKSTENSENASPTEQSPETHFTSQTSEMTKTATPDDSEATREDRLKTWQEKLKSQYRESHANRRLRNQTSINFDDVQKALQLSSSETKRNENPVQIATTFVPLVNNKSPAGAIDIPARKGKEHDNDEGFEESHSLMSESPSQGTSSGNYETDVADIADKNKVNVEENLNIDKKYKEDAPKVRNKTASKQQTRLTSSLTPTPLRRFSSLSSTGRSLHQPSVISKRVTPLKNTGNLKKSDSQSSVSSKKGNGVKKSSSHNSIVSSRSSLNSTTSVNTVKKSPIKRSASEKPKQDQVVRKPSITSSLNIRSSLRRGNPTTTSTNEKPPRPQSLSFMKPTASSTTKSTTSASPNKPTLKSRFR